MMADTVLEVQNVTQVVGVDSVKTFGQRLREKIVYQKQEEIEDGKIKITIILDPNGGGENEQVCSKRDN